eukprot:GHVT01100372.1.p4 GENE.GHVT01100372.1~~GHVT01100372.1.p4  ORF type:complete len:126 (+),score=9.32 GHVT01100372.1:896-1273(+)
MFFSSARLPFFLCASLKVIGVYSFLRALWLSSEVAGRAVRGARHVACAFVVSAAFPCADRRSHDQGQPGQVLRRPVALRHRRGLRLRRYCTKGVSALLLLPGQHWVFALQMLVAEHKDAADCAPF